MKNQHDVGLEYELVWNANEKLGLKLGTRDATDSSLDPLVPVIRKVQPSCSLHFQRNAVGDALVAVNRHRIDGLQWTQVCQLLDSASRPALLRFRRCSRHSVSNDSTWLEHRRTASLSSLESAFARKSV